ncbi:hypothetical protein OS493_038610 [Desmophyllum pertusum]|uniref:Uncharacterized protein n=1 Tax=Desmophyllum pertusum TaxID=174260 RepID=A0A9X0CWC4_9CNID|nr:hypothetical protein OS493_038610 [Desmophyllum pertusum]
MPECKNGDGQSNTSAAKGARLAVKCADLTTHRWELDEESVTIGGCVRSVAWDPFGERLAVIFKGTTEMYNALLLTTAKLRWQNVLHKYCKVMNPKYCIAHPYCA